VKNPSINVSIIAVVVILGLSLVYLSQPEAGLPQALLAAGVEIAILSFLVRSVPGSHPALVQLVVSAALVRVAAALLFHLVPQVQAVFGPDAPGYDAGGKALAEWWGGGAPAFWVIQRKAQAYYHLVAVQYFLLGYAPLLPKVTNGILGAVCTWYTYRIGTALFGLETGWRAASLVAYFPSLVLWSALNIRDGLAALVVLVIIWHTLSLKTAFSLPSVLMLVGGMILIGMIRDYMFPLMAGAVLVGMTLADTKTAPRSLLAMLALAVVIMTVYNQTHAGARFVEDTSLSDLQDLRKFSAIGANSSYLTDVDISTPLGALFFLPIGIAYFLLSPFPWQVGGLKHLIPMPEMLFWYSLVPMVWLGIRTLLRERFTLAIVLLLGCIFPTIGYGLGSSNVGTAYRHRGQIMPGLLIFAAAGLALRERERRRLAEEMTTANVTVRTVRPVRDATTVRQS
jgi:hypothetical protein